MPSMPRINKKCSRIAYQILGEPEPLRYKKSKKQREIDQVAVKESIYPVALRHV
jgi:hypothetical protein